MKNRKSYYSLLLALVLCLCLTACGGSDDTIDDGGEDYSGNEVNTPDSFEGMVKDSEPVSYTHLDVYKRQPPSRSSPRRSARR